MQRINKENGITLISMVVSIIVILIIASIPINMGIDSIDESKDERLQSELVIVQQALVREYEKARMLGYTNSVDRPANYEGVRLKISELPTSIKWAIKTEPRERYKSYYRLRPKDAQKLDIENAIDTYIINYFTGEVYNETVKENSIGETLYICLYNFAENNSNLGDTTSFNDWE